MFLWRLTYTKMYVSVTSHTYIKTYVSVTSHIDKNVCFWDVTRMFLYTHVSVTCSIYACFCFIYVVHTYIKGMFLWRHTDALSICYDQLTSFECKEITGYTEIWYLGADAPKVRGVEGTARNDGYDDEHGTYLKVS